MTEFKCWIIRGTENGEYIVPLLHNMINSWLFVTKYTGLFVSDY